MANKTMDLRQMKSLIDGGQVVEFNEKLRQLFGTIVRNMVVKNDKTFLDCIYLFNYSVTQIENLQKKNEDQVSELEIIKTQIKEYLFILQTYFKENVSLSVLDNIEQYDFSMLILDTLKLRSLNTDELKAKVLEEEYDDEQEILFFNTLGSLVDMNLIKQEEDEDVYSLADKGENLFDTYSLNKKLTNKYEKIKRQQTTSKNQKVDIELLDKIEKIKNAFTVLETMYIFSNTYLTVEDIEGETDLTADEVELVLFKLEALQLIEKEDNEEETLYAIQSVGKNVFKVYKKSKQYTNKYEKIKRVEKR